MRELRALLPPDSTKKRAKRKKTGTVATTGWLLEWAGPLDEGTRSQVHEALTRVSERFGLSMKAIEPAIA